MDRFNMENGQLTRPSRLRDIVAYAPFRFLPESLHYKLYLVFSSLGSLLGRLRTQLVKNHPRVSFGPAFEAGHPHLLRRNKRTLARKSGVAERLATLTWVDLQDLEIFLMGFDAGEQWASRNLCIEVDPDSTASARCTSKLD